MCGKKERHGAEQPPKSENERRRKNASMSEPIGSGMKRSLLARSSGIDALSKVTGIVKVGRQSKTNGRFKRSILEAMTEACCHPLGEPENPWSSLTGHPACWEVVRN